MNNSKVVSYVTPHVVRPCHDFQVKVTMENTGDTIWRDEAGVNYNIGATSPDDNTRWGTGREELPFGQYPPGSKMEKTLSLTAPNIVGTFTCNWKMVQEGVEWFGEVANASIIVQGQKTLPASYSEGLSGCEILTTPVYYGDGQWRKIPWTNYFMAGIRIYGTYLWTGIGYSDICDSHMEIKRVGDKSRIGRPIQWDHYAQPDGPGNGLLTMFGEKYFLIPSLETIEMHYMTSKHFVDPNAEVEAQHAVTIFYEVDK